MNKKLLDIQSKELKFIFELKKQSSCLVRLTNNTDHYVAFKVKTTSPKKYCVRPNVGIILPKSTRDFTVTMQAQGVAPPDMVCKDKFLIQSTVVPVGTTDENITVSMFAKEDGRYVQENKLRVILVSPPNSPVLSPIKGVLKRGPAYEASLLKDPVLNKIEILTPVDTVSKNVDASEMVNGEKLKPAKVEELEQMKDFIYVEELKPTMVTEVNFKKDVNSKELTPTMNVGLNTSKSVADYEDLKPAKEAELKPREDVISSEELIAEKDAELKPRKDVIDIGELTSTRDAELKPRKDIISNEELTSRTGNELKPSKDVVNCEELNTEKVRDLNGEELQPTNDTELNLTMEIQFERMNAVEGLKIVEEIEEIKSKLNKLESKLSEAEVTISEFKEERRLSIQEKNVLQEELAMLRSKSVIKNIQVGFPLLFVCVVAFISLVLGRLMS